MIEILQPSNQTISLNNTNQTITLNSVLPGIVSGESFDWELVTESRSLETNKGFYVDALTLCILTLPLEAQKEDRICVYAKSGVFRITQSSTQQCAVLDTYTTLGTSGSIESMVNGDLIELTYLNNIWVCSKIIGNFIVS
jgi:hypothetical protein